MKNGFSVGKVFGININIDWSWLFIFVLVSWSLRFLLWAGSLELEHVYAMGTGNISRIPVLRLSIGT